MALPDSEGLEVEASVYPDGSRAECWRHRGVLPPLMTCIQVATFILQFSDYLPSQRFLFSVF